MDFAPHKKFVATDKGSICYFVAGPETSTQTVMLLHGLSSNHTTWLTFMEMLATFGIRSIAPDLRGHGFSEKSKQKTWYTFPVFAEDIHRIADEEHLQKFDVVGYSFGGYIALAYAAEHPETLRSLSLVKRKLHESIALRTIFAICPRARHIPGTVLAWLSRPRRARAVSLF